MAVLARIQVENTCGCCGEVFLILGDCQSRTGTATLCGISGYSSDEAPYDAGDPWAWEGQMRKWRARKLDGEWTKFLFFSENCENCADGEKEVYSGTVEVGCDGIEAFGHRDHSFTEAESCGFADATGGDVLQTSPRYAAGAGACYNIAGWLGQTERTLTSLVTTGCGSCVNGAFGTVGNPRASNFTDGQVSETLDDEQYWYDALGAGAEAGEECCASTSSANAISPESVEAISATLTAVRRPVLVGGCEPLSLVTLTVTFVRIVDDEPDYMERVYAVQCGVPTNLQFPQPGPGDPAWCWHAIRIGS